MWNLNSSSLSTRFLILNPDFSENIVFIEMSKMVGFYGIWSTEKGQDLRCIRWMKCTTIATTFMKTVKITNLKLQIWWNFTKGWDLVRLSWIPQKEQRFFWYHESGQFFGKVEIWVIFNQIHHITTFIKCGRAQDFVHKCFTVKWVKINNVNG